MLSDMDELPTVQLGDFKLEFELGEPSPKVQEIARKELRETPDVVKEAIPALRDLLKGKYILHLYLSSSNRNLYYRGKRLARTIR